MEKTRLPKMPSPPAFLLQESAREARANIENNQPSPKPENAPRTVEYTLYHSVVEDRKVAEVRTAEIYSKYLEIVAFSEKLLKRLGRLQNYRIKVREIYDRALLSDKIMLDNLRLARRDLENTQGIINQLSTENEALRASVSAHQEAFREMSKKVGQAEAAMEYANEQFQLLSQEADERGEKVKNLEVRLVAAHTQIFEITELYKSLQKRTDQLNDENLLIQNQLRETQLKEAGIATLNEELTLSIPKLQKQIHILEDKLRIEREEHDKKERILLDQIDRLKENKIINNLVETSKKTVAQQGLAPVSNKRGDERPANRDQWNQFYARWSVIIDELSSHSKPLKEAKPEVSNFEVLQPLPQLVSEHGDIDWT